MSMTGANSVDALSGPFSVIVRTMSIGAEAVSLSVGARPVSSSFNAKVVSDISGTVPLTTSGVKTTSRLHKTWFIFEV